MPDEPRESDWSQAGGAGLYGLTLDELRLIILCLREAYVPHTPHMPVPLIEGQAQPFSEREALPDGLEGQHVHRDEAIRRRGVVSIPGS